MSIIELKDISVTFPGTKALQHISMSVEEGHIVALCGENGAGKSTLAKVIAGVYTKKVYTGEVLVHGKAVDFNNTLDAEAEGICIIHQELNLIPEMTVAENICLGAYPSRLGLVKRKEMTDRAANIFNELQIEIDPNAKISDLSISQQQMVEIAKSISRNPEVIIFDEATSSLTDKEVDILFEIMRRLQSRGTTMLYVSHKLDEIFKICDDVVILKDGQFVNMAPTKDMDKDMLITQMVGRELKDMYAPKTKKRPEGMKPVLDVRNWDVYKTGSRTEKIVEGASMQVYAGEILGIYGLMGAGRTEFVSSIFEGDDVPTSGELYINGEKVHIKNCKDAINHGIGLVTEDRRKTGLCLIHSIRDNATLASMKQYANKLTLLDDKKQTDAMNSMIPKLSIRLADIFRPVSTLSGGNQQKIVLSKWLLNNPQILILDEPTRGIDVGAKKEIYFILQKLADAGVAVVVISSELPEVMGVSDRILIMREGTITGEVSQKEASEELLAKYAMKGDVLP